MNVQNNEITGFMASPSRSPIRFSSVGPLPDLNSTLNTSLKMRTDKSNNTPLSKPIFKTPSQLRTNLLSQTNFMAPLQAVSSSVNNSIISVIPPVQIIATPKLQTSIIPTIQDSSMEFATPEGLVQNQDILRLLIDKGFMPYNTIMINSPSGISAKYIKVIDERGNTAYVDIDMDGNVMKTQNDITTDITQNITSIPLSVKMGLYKCADMDVCGVAMECSDGICMLTRDDNNEMKETMLEKISTSEENVIKEIDSPLGYPVVKLSEILENPIRISKIIDNTNDRIRSNAIHKYINDFKNMEKTKKLALTNIEEYDSKLNNGLTILMRELNRLEKIRNKFDLMPPTTDEQREQSRKNSYLIKHYNDVINNLLIISNNITRYQKIFNEIAEDAKSFSDIIDEIWINAQNVTNESNI